MSIVLILVPATLAAAVYESIPKPNRKIRRQRGKNNKRVVW
jgi:hypothetical protein